MRNMHDTWVMSKRSIRHTVRSLDTIITVLAMPIATMLMMVYVFGGVINTGSVKYINFAVPGVIVMTVVSGIAYAAFRLNLDIQKGFINRFRTMPVASSSILGGQVVSSVLSNLFSVAVVLLVALLAGFRSDASLMAWLMFGGMLVLLTTAFTWLAMFFGLLAKSAEGAGAFSYVLLLLVFVSSAFTPTGKMSAPLRAFAEHQPMTPIIQTLRSLLVNGTVGSDIWIALVWSAGLLAVSYMLAVRTYKRRVV
ncbi:MAG: ABC transporter permease [Candidatus Saccharimonadales bacterium]|jgi:ABC-2 type transport system permease protein